MFSELKKDVINAIADSVFLAVVLVIIQLIFNQFKKLDNYKKLKQGTEYMIINCLLPLKYGANKSTDISTINLNGFCSELLEKIEKYNKTNFAEFQYRARNNYISIAQNVALGAQIDSIHLNAYASVVSNLYALIAKWDEEKQKLEKIGKNHPVDFESNLFDMYLKSKNLLKIFIMSCRSLSECEFEDFSANYKYC